MFDWSYDDLASSSTFKALLSAWLLAGTLDISAAAIYYAGAAPIRVMRLLQEIASGVLGRGAFSGETAALGLTLHYFIALMWTLIFFLVARFSRRLPPNLFLTGMA